MNNIHGLMNDALLGDLHNEEATPKQLLHKQPVVTDTHHKEFKHI